MFLRTLSNRFAVAHAVVALLALVPAARGATFGKPVPIGGHASDIALDEGRGVLYIANYTANRIEVMSLEDNTIGRSFSVAAQPAALAISPDGRYLVVTHFAPYETPDTSGNALTVISLDDGKRRTFGMGQAPLGVAFGIDGLALVVTTSDFLLFDPVSGSTQVIGSVGDITATALPAELATFPPEIIQASVTASGDGRRVYGFIDSFKSDDGKTVGVRFSYSVASKSVMALGLASVPALGPRTMSLNKDGSFYLVGWGLFQCGAGFLGECNINGPLVAQFANAKGELNAGGHAIDSDSGTIYAQIPEATQQTDSVPAPILAVMDADNLTVRERIRMPENLAGRSVLSADGSVMYSVSDSGVMVLPVGLLKRAPRVTASVEDVVFRGNSCDRSTMTQQIAVTDASGGRVAFAVSPSAAGIEVSPSTGITPAVVTVRVNPEMFSNQKGTVAAQLDITAPGAVNVVNPVRVLINAHDPDQRGTFINVPGKLVDLLADPARNRFYALRQDKNQVLVFDGTTYSQVATLRTSNVPTKMAITFDRKYLLVGHDESQLAYVYDLDTLEPSTPIRFQLGHYPRSLASSGKTILAACRVAGPEHTIDRVDFAARTAAPMARLGIYKNSVHINTVLEAAPNGGSILAAMPDGNVMLYDANADTFTISRKDFPALSGSYAASSYGQYAVDNNLLNESLVLTGKLDATSGTSSGFAFVDQYGFRTTAATAGHGNIQRVNLNSGAGILVTRMVEAPVTGTKDAAFTRTLAPLADRSALIALTVSGLTVLPWNYDAAVAPPQLERVVNAADMSSRLAPGSLIAVLGRDLSPVNIASKEIPLPTALGESCLSVNGVPVPMLFASSTRINAQLPFTVDGKAAMVLRTPGGVSDTVNLTILPAAPGVFRDGTAGPESGIATVVRLKNSQLVTASNPIHPDEQILIYLTGMGKTSPGVEAGTPGPSDPLSVTLIEPTVTLGGVNLPILYSGLAPGQVGVYQIQAIVPFRGIPEGFDVPLTITQASSSTTLTVRVVD